MGTPRVAGIETEYGILIRGAAEVDPFSASDLLLEQFARSDETVEPLGMRVGSPDLDGYMLANGARLYIDHAHPEYSTPETATPRDAVAADKAGEVLLERCQCRANASGALPSGQELVLYKNNSDGKGQSYGCHENYLVAPDTFEELVACRSQRVLGGWVPFLVTRGLLCGAGKMGAENGRDCGGFQLTQRADFMEELVGLQTTYRRPLVNTRDEPHADRLRFRRLHVILGDANMAEFSTYLKIGTTTILLMMLEDDAIPTDMMLQDPIEAISTVSHDLSFSEELPLADGRAMTALAMQEQFHAAAHEYLAEHGGTDELHGVVVCWGDTCAKLASDWRALRSRLDWAIKRHLLEKYLSAQGCDWETVRSWEPVIQMTLDQAPSGDGGATCHPPILLRQTRPEDARLLDRHMLDRDLEWDNYWAQRDIYFTLRRLDLQYHDLRRGPTLENGGLYNLLQASGAVERVVSDDEIALFVDSPPHDTRAHVRGMCVSQHSRDIAHVDWAEVVFTGTGPNPTWQLDLDDPAANHIDPAADLTFAPPDVFALLEGSREHPGMPARRNGGDS